MSIGSKKTPQTTGHGEKLNRKQELAISALLTETSIEKAAERVGIADKTLREWLKKESFKAAFRAACREVLDQAIYSLQKSCTEAAKILLEIAADKDKPATARVSACKTIFDTAYKGLEFGELCERIESLEATVSQLLQKEN